MGVKIIKNEKLWMEEEAIHQLERIASFDGVIDIVGLPDLHPGKTPVGATIKTKGVIYPFWIANDIGCGMSLFNTNIKMKKFDIEKNVRKLEDTKIVGQYSIGGGNHFAELQAIDKIYNKEIADRLFLNKNYVHLLIHSGSRNLGETIYREYASIDGLKEGTKEFDSYLEAHDKAIVFAKENRNQLATIFMDMIGLKYDNQLIVDCIHNYIEIIDNKYYHHKGSISSVENKFAIIAGSRGSYSYIVKCIAKEESLYSISHGGGRKWPRNLCKGRLENRYKKDELKTTTLGGYVISNNKALLYEEATEAYKNIDDVIDTLLEHETIELVARLKPLVTYKC